MHGMRGGIRVLFPQKIASKAIEIHLQIPYGKRLGLLYIGLFTGLFAALLIPQNQSIALAELFYPRWGTRFWRWT